MAYNEKIEAIIEENVAVDFEITMLAIFLHLASSPLSFISLFSQQRNIRPI